MPNYAISSGGYWAQVLEYLRFFYIWCFYIKEEYDKAGNGVILK